ncbi:hypothetical protein E3P92_00363 [Wallemia ichthyophaga]|uniref:Ribosome biogenesis protein RLP24 n=1 Tax=Wallemia ichthyophaga TaxID=245174 RepID=A0A4T0G005_WALIC|nr:hypothetical protein E3P91_00719 [Wallemia ichthyophaga]TIA81627.1 hypothetical protein E3P98_01899 [Wallemia ichthyophaga]TIA94080.1 hypothetical protein E3P97_00325 [Wallemia ichthyophaga]TIA96503.1 hypothetical protein E3P96_03593 [Wallemia ichthyophaga]TIB03828.1 hypothetical protein E3P95_00428 [Wallemia ichthyophaga]
MICSYFAPKSLIGTFFSHPTTLPLTPNPTGSSMKVELCSFSGQKIYPAKGRLYVRLDNRVFRFANGKCESLFLQRKNPRKIAWTAFCRKLHKKGVTEEVHKKKGKKSAKTSRGIVGLDLEAIQAKRTQKPEVRTAARQEAIKQAKESKAARANATKAHAPVAAGPGATKGAGPNKGK